MAVHADDDVFFVHAGEGDEGVGLGQALAGQQGLAGLTAPDHRGAGQLVGQKAGAGAVLLHDFDRNAGVQKALGQVITHLATAHQHDLADLLLCDTQIFDELGQVHRPGGDKMRSPWRSTKLPSGMVTSPLAQHRAHQHLDLGDLVELVQGNAVQAAALVDAEAHDLDPALAKPSRRMKLGNCSR